MILHPQRNILIERLGDQVLLFDLDRNLPYVLNGVAAFIFLNMDGELSQEGIAQKVCGEFDVEFHRALDDVKGIYKEFIKKKLVTYNLVSAG